jgi:hypothetical protein
VNNREVRKNFSRYIRNRLCQGRLKWGFPVLKIQVARHRITLCLNCVLGETMAIINSSWTSTVVLFLFKHDVSETGLSPSSDGTSSVGPYRWSYPLSPDLRNIQMIGSLGQLRVNTLKFPELAYIPGPYRLSERMSSKSLGRFIQFLCVWTLSMALILFKTQGLGTIHSPKRCVLNKIMTTYNVQNHNYSTNIPSSK